ncbi:hypothetical protein M3231_10560 [Neobacillus mesonae]|nr:hypothetical protein [Neobacillus mesonae]
MHFGDMRKFGISVLISLLLVLLVDLFTFKYPPGGSTSGNGNPGILVLAPALLYLIGLLIYTFFFMKNLFVSVKNAASKEVPILLICFILTFLLLITMDISDLRNQLGGFTNDPESAVYRFGWLNQYTNTLFYNIYIVLLGISLVSLVSWITVSASTSKQKDKSA